MFKNRFIAIGIAILAVFSPVTFSKRGKVLFRRFVKHNSPLVKVLKWFYDVRINRQGELRILLKRHNRG